MQIRVTGTMLFFLEGHPTLQEEDRARSSRTHWAKSTWCSQLECVVYQRGKGEGLMVVSSTEGECSDDIIGYYNTIMRVMHKSQGLNNNEDPGF